LARRLLRQASLQICGHLVSGNRCAHPRSHRTFCSEPAMARFTRC
jgi:hypothetical protein